MSSASSLRRMAVPKRPPRMYGKWFLLGSSIATAGMIAFVFYSEESNRQFRRKGIVQHREDLKANLEDLRQQQELEAKLRVKREHGEAG